MTFFRSKTVIAVLFFGFGDDARGMQNTIEVCQELTEDIGVIIIPNSKFMNTNSSKVKAESDANKKFIEYTRILVGKDIHESTQNIDITDLKKVIMTPYLETMGIQADPVPPSVDPQTIMKSASGSILLSSPRTPFSAS